MLLKNKSARLITINGDEVKLDILPGNNPSIEVPNELCEGDFIRALIGNGDLVVECEDDAGEEVLTGSAEYDGFDKKDLVELCEGRDIEVKAKDTVKKLIEKLEAQDAEG